MRIEGSDYVSDLSLETVQWAIYQIDLEPVMENDAMWHYMTTGQVLEGQINGRTAEEGTDQCS